MFRKIFFVSLQYINFILLTVWLVYALFKWLPKKIKQIFICDNHEELSTEAHKSAVESQWRRYIDQLYKISGVSLLFMAVSILATCLDGVGNSSYITKIVLCILLLGLLWVMDLTNYLQFSIRRCGAEFSFSNFTSRWKRHVTHIIVIYCAVLIQTIYLTVCLLNKV